MTTKTTSKLDFVLRLVDQVTAPAARISKQLTKVAEVGKAGFVQMGAGVAGMVGSVVGALKLLEPARQHMGALDELASLDVAEDALDRLSRKSLAFSMAYGTNAQDFLASALTVESAIKGLAGGQLAHITNASNVLAKATRADANTMATYVGQMVNLFQGQADAMGKTRWVDQLAGQTALAVKLFRTSGDKIGDGFKAIGSMGNRAGVDLAEQMAILGTVGQTADAGAAGGMYKSFFENVGRAQDKLGLQLTDTQGRLLPILQILERVRGKVGDLGVEANASKLREAFGGQAAQLIATLLDNTEGLAKGIDALGKVQGLEQAERMARKMVDPWDQLMSTLRAIQVTFGKVLLPVLNPLIERVTRAAATFQRWLTLFPNLARWLGYLTLGVLALVAAAGALTVLGGLVTVLGILASPVALLVLGISALVTSVGAAIIWWDELKATFGDTGWFQALMAVVSVGAGLLSVFVAVLNFVWIALQQIWRAGVQVVEWFGVLEGVASVATTIWEGFLNALNTIGPFTFLRNALGQLIDMLNKIPGIQIDTSFGEMSTPPELPAPVLPVSPSPVPAPIDAVLARALPSKATNAERYLAPVPLAMPPTAKPLLAAVPPPVEQLPPAGLSPALERLQPAAVTPALERPQPAAMTPALERLQPATVAPALERLQPVTTLPVVDAGADTREELPRPRQAASAVPPGGLLKALQQTFNNNTTQRNGTHIEQVTVNTSEPITPYALENMIAMAAG